MGTLAIFSQIDPPTFDPSLEKSLTPAGRDVFHGLLFHFQLEQEIL